MLARRFTNQNEFGRLEKRKEAPRKGADVRRGNENGAVSKLPVAVKVHKKDTKGSHIDGAVRKCTTDEKTRKHLMKVKKDVMPTTLTIYEETSMYMSICEEEPVSDLYARDIHAYLKTIETKCCPKFDFVQKNITEGNRRKLLAWMRDVQDFLGMHQETLHLAITITDIILQNQTVKLEEYQLLGLVGFFVAAKFMERYIPGIDTLMYLASHAYNSHLILQKEKEVLHSLEYDLNLPTSSWFLEYYANDEESADVRRLAEALLDLFIMDSSSASIIHPSVRAASSLMVANDLCGKSSAQFERSLLDKCCCRQSGLQTANQRLNSLIRNCNDTDMFSIGERVTSLL